MKRFASSSLTKYFFLLLFLWGLGVGLGFFAGAWGGGFCLGFGGLVFGFFLRREDGEMGEEKRR